MSSAADAELIARLREVIEGQSASMRAMMQEIEGLRDLLKVPVAQISKICLHCRKPFLAGLGTGRRIDSKFCSAAHRIEFNSIKRSRP